MGNYDFPHYAEVRKQNEDGTVSNEVKERTYNLKSSAQGRMIQVSIPANVPLREFAYDAEVELVNPIMDTVANYVFEKELLSIGSLRPMI